MLKKAVVYDHVFRVVGCRRCGHIYVNPRLDDDAIEALYDEAYYDGRGFDRNTRYADLIEGPGLIEHFSDEILTLEEVAGTLAGRTILDIGCGSGGLVRALRSKGAEAFGFDTSERSRELAREYGTPLAEDSIDRLHAQGRRYDIVAAMEVIEHTLSPTAFLQSLRTLVRPGGVLFIETGNWNLVRLVPNTPYVMPEGHIHYLTPVTLNAFFRKVGLDITGTCNFTWAGWRRAGKHLGPQVGLPVTRLVGAVISRVAPQFGPFPVGLVPRA
ncbi:MAG: class I SAM-dependent methyltransferase [Candidatus Aquilonibacter sp.]